MTTLVRGAAMLVMVMAIATIAACSTDQTREYTLEGGKVTARERDGWAELEVSDTGVGIPEDQLPLIFERFHRADPSRTAGGAGLGLSIARQIAEAHGGQIEATSEPAEGSAFTLRIPRNAPTTGPEDWRASQPNPG